MTVYDYSAKTIRGEDVSLSQYRGKVLLIVNTASACGFTPQYQGLQELYTKHREAGLEILGFPCNQFGGQEPGAEAEIAEFCQVNFGVTFPLFAKVDVNGDDAHPLFKYLSKEAPGILGTKSIKWNFTKFLVDREGTVVDRYASTDSPEKLEKDIVKYL
jgi:glutathione peroxidase